MHFYNFHPADFNNSARHLTLVERALYRDLIDMYYGDEQPIDVSDVARLERRLLCRTQDEKAALAYVLSEFFVKRGNKYHHHRIDREIKNYRHAHRNDSVTATVTDNNAHRNATVTEVTPLSNAERQQRNRAERKQMIDDLNMIGVSVTTSAGTKLLRELTDINADAIRNAKLSNTDDSNITDSNAHRNDSVTDSNGKIAAITNNQEPITNNQDKNNTTPREQNFDIRDWVEPEYSDFIEILQDNDIHMALPNDLYLAETQKFKGYNANLAAQGKVSLVDDSYRMTKFVDWFKILANKQRASKQAVAAPVVHDDDLPEIYRQSSQSDQTYHPSHAPVAPAKKLPGMFSAYGQNYMPFDGMDAKETFEAVTSKMGKFYTFAEAYQVLKNELSGVVAWKR